MEKLTSAELDELRQLFHDAVLFGPDVDPDYEEPRVLPCWFGANVDGIDECEGKPEGAHWLKRQVVERTMARELSLPEIVVYPSWQRRWKTFPEEYVAMGLSLLFLAAWDPRNAVVGCNKHHTRFDSQRMPTLEVWRHEVPDHVEEFAADWGLEPALERRNAVVTEEI